MYFHNFDCSIKCFYDDDDDDDGGRGVAGVTYLDENLTARMSSLYLGIFYAVAIFGPAVGYILGGYLLSIFTDFDRVDTSE